MLPSAVKTVAASALKAPGPILDAARDGLVTITRRNEEFVLVSRRRLTAIVQDALDPRPKSLDDLLKGFDAEAHREALGGWLADPPVGREVL
jgi:hypothetical protein